MTVTIRLTAPGHPLFAEAAELLDVAQAARAEGAHRLSLQTEAGNCGALELYAQAGFEPVGDVRLLHRHL